VGIGDRIGRSWKVAVLLAAGAVGGAAAVAVATVPDSSGVIHACVRITTIAGATVPDPSGANVRIVDSPGQPCTTSPAGPNTETALNWNVTGPQGPPGQNGTSGTNGTPGTQGPPGADGKTATVTAGNTFTIGGAVVTVGQSRGLTLAPPSFTGNGFGTLTLTAGSPISADITGMSFGPHALGTGQGSGKTSFHDISVTKQLDKASAKLQLACADGRHAGIEYVVVKHPVSRSKRDDYVKLTGQKLYPAIELDDGTVIRRESKEMAEMVRSGQLAQASGGSDPGETPPAS
jgi:Type VI secretion system effector, Hcp